ncbi:zinc-binding alcohol dehydrogenase family protein [Flavobacterium sp. NKUCC04_CG]|uniref:quinone oxidoreductase family protein n=1 Tax=Flavobacterium sp. NKUCC04_CG TaxID=2842121 RepID=UPI001C5B922B|nr:zinc-binding alcohol dehydrogenase family protein [Flavobacterium sp. NKUCC04_CG]MBW3519828.1 zinc-binding alcohol dehydrogenase family protein [Flavobacterium sp. NKUCC04_CG]
MKAIAVMTKGSDPVYVEKYEQPLPKNDGEIRIHVKAVSIKNLDRAIASGKHYSAQTAEFVPRVIGTDGVGLLDDKTRVYGFGMTGMLAEKALVKKNSLVMIPDGLSNELAAALPNALMGSVIALMLRAKLQKGQHVLINGATGITGKVAIQMAKYYGASKVSVTGRNEEVLSSLLDLGADTLVSLKQSEGDFIEQIKAIDSESPVDIVIDYLWGHSAKMILEALKGKGHYTHKTKFVNVGAMSGDLMELSSSILRGTDIQLLGSGLGSWNDEEVKIFFKALLPEAFNLAAAGTLKMDISVYPMTAIDEVWNPSVMWNSRLVFTVD